MLTSAIAINLVVYSVFHPLIYNGYRHYLFLIACFTLLVALTLADFISKGLGNVKSRAIMAVVAFLALILVKDFIGLHPYQYIYFNELSGGLKGAGKSYDSDYWSASRIEAVRWISENLNVANEVVYVCNMPNIVSYYSRDQMKVTREQAYATITLCDPKRDLEQEVRGELLHRVTRSGVSLTVIRRLR